MTRSGSVRVIGLGLLLASIVYSWIYLAPRAPWQVQPLNPAFFALCGATLLGPVYVALAMMRNRCERLERLVIASFLACMPVMYLWGALRTHDIGGARLESIGLIVYGLWAVVGYRRSSMLIGAGIAAHGIGWDAWHHGHVGYMEPWYPVWCLLVDIVFALAIAGVSLDSSVASQASTQEKGRQECLRSSE